MSAFIFEDLLQLVQDERITRLAVAPPIVVLLCKYPNTLKHDLSSVRWLTCGAAPLAKSLHNECKQKFGLAIGQGWGMTETTGLGTVVPRGV